MDHQKSGLKTTDEDQEEASTLSEKDLTRAKNANPRANENIDGDEIDTGSTEGVGSEITDGEAS